MNGEAANNGGLTEKTILSNSTDKKYTAMRR
jgi:hypothetical protein